MLCSVMLVNGDFVDRTDMVGIESLTTSFDVFEADAIEGRVCVDGIELVVEYGECRLYITVYRLPTHISVEEEST